MAGFIVGPGGSSGGLAVRRRCGETLRQGAHGRLGGVLGAAGARLRRRFDLGAKRLDLGVAVMLDVGAARSEAVGVEAALAALVGLVELVGGVVALENLVQHRVVVAQLAVEHAGRIAALADHTAEADAALEAEVERLGDVGLDLAEGRNDPLEHQVADALGDGEADAEMATLGRELAAQVAHGVRQLGVVRLGDDVRDLGEHAELAEVVDRLHRLAEGVGEAGDLVGVLGVDAVQRQRHLVQPGLDQLAGIGEIGALHAVGLHFDGVEDAERAGVADEVGELRVDRRFAAGDHQVARAVTRHDVDLLLQLVERDVGHGAVDEAEGARHVAVAVDADQAARIDRRVVLEGRDVAVFELLQLVDAAQFPVHRHFQGHRRELGGAEVVEVGLLDAAAAAGE